MTLGRLIIGLAQRDGSGPAGAFGVALLFVLGASAVRVPFEPFLQGANGYVFMFPAIVLATLWAGRAAGAIAVALSIAAVYAFVPPFFEVVGGWRSGAAKVASFVPASLLIVLVASELRRALRAVEAQAAGVRASEARFRRVFDSPAVGKAIYDVAENRTLVVNDRLLEIIGRDRGSFERGEWTWDSITRPDYAHVDAEVGRRLAAEGRVAPVEKVLLRPDGTEVPVLISVAPLGGDDASVMVVVQDLTEVRRAEAALREQAEVTRAITQHAAEAMFLMDREGRCTYANPAAEALFGWPAEALKGKVLHDVLHPRRPDGSPFPVAECPLIHVFESGLPLERHEDVFFHRDGRPVEIACSNAPIAAPDGTVTGAVLVVRDIGERKKAEAALRESEARFRTMADSAPVMLWMSDQNGGCLYLNSPLRVFWGAPQDLQGFDFMGTVHDEDREALIAVLVDAMARKTAFETEARYRRADGAWRVLHTTALPRLGPDGDFLGMIGVNLDVTEARGAEAALRESEARFRLIADSAPVMMWVTRPGGERDFVNRAYGEFLDLPYEESRTFDWRHALHPDDQARIYQEQRVKEASGEAFTLEARYRRHDGEWRWLRSRSQPRFAPDGSRAGFVGVAFDVTEAKQAEQDLKRINELLEERVNEALADKEKAEAALMRAQKMEAIGRLTGGVAHDFNNLLTVVVGGLDMILKHPDDAAKRERLAKAALAAARRGERLTHQLLAFSRRQALRPETLDVRDLLRESEPLLRRAVGEAVTFELCAPDDPAVVRVDPGQFEAALLNLIVNARDATPAGGGITVQADCCVLGEAEAEAEPGRYVRVRVGDTGTGMEPDVLAKVFEPFFTTKAVGKGTGLGLSQVYGFARQSGGAVAVDSAPGRGTLVTLWLPEAQADAPATQGLRFGPVEPAARAALDVLLVEDDPEVGAIAETMLTGLGHRVRRAEDAASALKVLKSKARVDLLLTDLIMPGGMDGVALARRAVVMRPGLEVLLTSGYAGEALDQALGDAPWPLLRKPYAEAELAAVLQTLGRAAEPAGV